MNLQPRPGQLIYIIVAVLSVSLVAGYRFWAMIPDADVDAPLPIRLPEDARRLQKLARTLIPAHLPKRAPGPDDWLARFTESGQTFPQFVQISGGSPLQRELSGIDVIPLGEFDSVQQRILDQTVEFLELAIGVPVHLQPAEAFPPIPASARRMRGETAQILSTWILNDVLKPRRRPEATATLALVTCDLWPGDLNWVFGQASLRDRVGVWSLWRNGDPRAGDTAFRLTLRRTLKTAVHETGHMLRIPHCTAYECVMNGSASRDESDGQPLEFCPECQPKLWWGCGARPLDRCRRLADYCRRTGLAQEHSLFERECQILEALPESVGSHSDPSAASHPTP